ncbi:unnamed protein product [Soboliphyme baturini]|uniref:Major facilitator superfamily (MFS) profile domain-containing protein n=1 Tax=Soboliphyme baturini TaxID=241478 RepID=A0A3P8CIH0_9BILA|nr:unnamed protein product [Soboliphyme baturini]
MRPFSLRKKHIYIYVLYTYICRQTGDYLEESMKIIVSSTVISAAIFSIFGGYVNNRFGRKITILLSSVLFTIGAVVMAASDSKEILLVGRIVVGAGVGTSSCAIPAYIAEITPCAIRGRMLVTFQLMITFGFWVAGLLNAAFSYIKDDNVNWRLMLGVAGIPAVIQLVGFIQLPESPRWLALNGQKDKAEKILTKIYGNDDEAKIAAVMDVKRMIEENELTHAVSGGSNIVMSMLKQSTTRKALLIGCMLQTFQQLCGINTVMYYSASIIQSGGIRSRTMSIWMTSVTSGVNFFCTFIGIYLIERIGRRSLLLYSTAGVLLSCFILGTGFHLISEHSPPSATNASTFHPYSFGESSECYGLGCDACSYMVECGFCIANEATSGLCMPVYNNETTGTLLSYASSGSCAPNVSLPEIDNQYQPVDPTASFDYGFCITEYSWLPIMGMVLYLCSFSVGMPWTDPVDVHLIIYIFREIYPNWARSVGNSASTCVNWLCNIIVSFTFLTMSRAITRQGAFFLYGCICCIGIISFYLLVPETKGLRMEDIQSVLRSSWIVPKIK